MLGALHAASAVHTCTHALVSWQHPLRFLGRSLLLNVHPCFPGRTPGMCAARVMLTLLFGGCLGKLVHTLPLFWAGLAMGPSRRGDWSCPKTVSQEDPEGRWSPSGLGCSSLMGRCVFAAWPGRRGL